MSPGSHTRPPHQTAMAKNRATAATARAAAQPPKGRKIPIEAYQSDYPASAIKRTGYSARPAIETGISCSVFHGTGQRQSTKNQITDYLTAFWQHVLHVSRITPGENDRRILSQQLPCNTQL